LRMQSAGVIFLCVCPPVLCFCARLSLREQFESALAAWNDGASASDYWFSSRRK
jgi:hypothetical protein